MRILIFHLLFILNLSAQEVETPQGFGGAGFGGGGFGLQNAAHEVPKLPEGVDKQWFLDNTAIPDVLKRAFLQDEEAFEEYAHKAYGTCIDIRDNALADFFNKEISPLLRTKPQFCAALKKELITKEARIYGRGSSYAQGQPDLKIKNVDVAYTNYFFDEGAIENEELLSPYEKLIIRSFKENIKVNKENSLSIPLPLEQQKSLSPTEKEQLGYLIRGPFRKLSGISPILLNTMLSRLWSGMGTIQQMRALKECPAGLGLNKDPAYWEMSGETKSDKESRFSEFIKICQAKEVGDIISYLDDSVMGEFSVYLKSQSMPLDHLFGLCQSWPEDGVATPKRLPKTTIERVLYNAAIFNKNIGQGIYSTGYLNLLNKKENGQLSEKELTALSDYTGNGSYDRINAYEMWGRIGVWFVEDPSFESKLENYYQNVATPPQREDFESNALFNHAYALYLKERATSLPRLYGDEKARAKAIKLYNEQREKNGPMKTASGTHLSQTSKDLRKAIENLGGFKGVTFGGHQLSGHPFKSLSLREGGIFRPGFFMSTSTDQQTALSFLGIERKRMERLNLDSDQRERGRSPSEEVTGHLFVVKNKTGAPIANYSVYSYENEVLLHPEAQYKVLKIEPLEVDGINYPNANVIYIQELDPNY